jgi:hypothetical protein
VADSTSRAIPAEFAAPTVREGPLELQHLPWDGGGSVDGVLTGRGLDVME